MTESAIAGLRGHDPIHRRLSGRFQVGLVWEGVLVGLVGGAVVTLYRVALKQAEALMRWVVGVAWGNPLAVAGWLAALACMLLVVGRLMVWEPFTVGSGIPQVDAEVMGRLDMPWYRVLPAKFVEGSLGALAGLSMGREGPSVMLGGMSGKAVSRALGRGRGEERLLVTCGAGAGMAAAFHAPLTGVMFALEEIHKTFDAALIIGVMSAAVTADWVVSQLIGLEPSVRFAVGELLAHDTYALVVAFGIVMGLVGAVHNLGMFACQDAFGHLRRKGPYARLAIPFALTAVAAFTVPELLCGGDAILELLGQPWSLTWVGVAGLLVGKYLMTTIAFGAGTPGGTLFPLVVVGALAGALFGIGATRALGMDAILVSNFMILGIAGMFASAIRAPVTAVILVFELTGSLQALLSVAIVSVVAFVTANLLKVDAYYEHLTAKLLGVSVEDTHTRWGSRGRQLQSYVIEAGSVLAGATVSDVEWPGGSLLVNVSHLGVESVAHGSTRLEAGDRILVLLDESKDAGAERWFRSHVRGSLLSTS